jgi:hypothetical protein
VVQITEGTVVKLEKDMDVNRILISSMLH